MEIGIAPGALAGASIGCFTGIITNGFQESDSPIVSTAGDILDIGGTIQDGFDIGARAADDLIDSAF